MEPLADEAPGWPHAERLERLQRLPIVVLGAGLMGSAIGVEYATHGFRVHFLTADVERGRDRVRDAMARAATLGLASRRVVEAATGRISVATQIVDLPESAQLVLESLPEDVDLKVSVLTAVAARATTAILASNTSSLSITELGRRIGLPGRTLGMHYWNPPMLMPLVELTPTPSTDPLVVETARGLVEALGKTVILVRHDVPGFIWNRLQMAILREALWLVSTGVATVEDIDTVTRLGLARRWRQTGLFQSIHLGGPETWQVVAANLFPTLSNEVDAPGLVAIVEAASGQWSESLERRDLALAEDGAHAAKVTPSHDAPRPAPEEGRTA